MRKSCISFLILMSVVMTGCKIIKVKNIRVEELDYTVVRECDIPESLLTEIQGKKAEPFEMIYEREGYLYAARGYGKQESGGYSIVVSDLYLGKDAIYVQTDLVGPETTEEKTKGVSYPYIVVKLEDRSETVIFQ